MDHAGLMPHYFCMINYNASQWPTSLSDNEILYRQVYVAIGSDGTLAYRLIPRGRLKQCEQAGYFPSRKEPSLWLCL